jgi:DNA-binding NarL/FixJ family response regulator
VLVITTFASDDYVFAALRAGASGFVLKRASADELIAAVHAVASGESLLYPSAVREMALRFAAPERYAGEPLTAREHDVLVLLGQGLSNPAIAERLVVSVETVRSHVAALLRKLGARDRTHAVVIAYATGLDRIGGLDDP